MHGTASQTSRVVGSSTRVNDEGLRPFAQYPALEILRLDRTELRGEGMVYLREVPTLRELYLHQAHRFGDAGLAALAGAPPCTPSTSIRRVTDAGLRSLRALPSLRTLLLGNTRIGDEGARQVTALNATEVLDLSETDLSDEGLAR